MRFMSVRVLSLVTLTAFATAPAQAAGVPPEEVGPRPIKEITVTSLGKLDTNYVEGSKIVVSADGTHYAYLVHTADGKFAPVIDGARMEPLGPKPRDWGCAFSPRGDGFVLWAQLRERQQGGFSIYHGESYDPGAWLVITKDQRAEYASVKLPAEVFSADGKHFAYIASKQEAGDNKKSYRCHLILDGHPFDHLADGHKPEFYEDQLCGVAFSRDGKTLVYARGTEGPYGKSAERARLVFLPLEGGARGNDTRRPPAVSAPPSSEPIDAQSPDESQETGPAWATAEDIESVVRGLAAIDKNKGVKIGVFLHRYTTKSNIAQLQKIAAGLKGEQVNIYFIASDESDWYYLLNRLRRNEKIGNKYSARSDLPSLCESGCDVVILSGFLNQERELFRGETEPENAGPGLASFLGWFGRDIYVLEGTVPWKIAFDEQWEKCLERWNQQRQFTSPAVTSGGKAVSRSRAIWYSALPRADFHSFLRTVRGEAQHPGGGDVRTQPASLRKSTPDQQWVRDQKNVPGDAARPTEGQVVVTEDPGQATYYSHLTPGPTGKDWAYVQVVGQRVPGERQEYRLVVNGRVVRTDRTGSTCWGGLAFSPVAFSPDSQRFAFVVSKSAGRDSALYVMCDGREGAQYSEIGPPVFSGDSKHVAYLARTAKVWTCVIDGKETGTFSKVAHRPLFSPDSRLLRLVAGETRKRSRDESVEDREPSMHDPDWKVFDVDLTGGPARVVSSRRLCPGGVTPCEHFFSPDGRRWVCVVKEDATTTVLLDGAPIRERVAVPDNFRVVFDRADRFSFPVIANGEIVRVEVTLRYPSAEEQ